MKRKREAIPQLSAFAARKLAEAKAAEAQQAANSSASEVQPTVAETQSGSGDETADSHSDHSGGEEFDQEDQDVNSFAVLSHQPRRVVQQGSEIHDSRALQVAEAEAAAKFKPRLHELPDGLIILGLAGGEKVALLGFAHFTVTHGSVTIYGASIDSNLDSRDHYLAAAKTSSSPVIEAVSEDPVDQEYFNDQVVALIRFQIQQAKQSELVATLEQYPLGKSCLSGSSLQGDPKTLAFSPPDSNSVSIPPPWTNYLSSIVKYGGCNLLIGAKGVGKSTLAKLMLNSCFTSSDSVYYLDLDPGQPEFSPPGLISLFHLTHPIFSTSPAFGELYEPLKSHWIGETSPKEDPMHYSACIADLINVLATHRLNDEPIIVNTPGWIKGTGKDLLLSLYQLLDHRFPQELKVLALGHVEMIASLSPHVPVIALPAHTSTTSPGPSAADLRTLNLLSYVHRIAPLQWSPTPISLIPRYSVSFMTDENTGDTAQSRQTSGGIWGIAVLRDSLQPNHLLHAILGTFVSVISIHASHVPSPQRTFSADGLPMIIDCNGGDPFDPSFSESLGLALLLGIDLPARQIHLTTPIPSDTLEKAGTIVLVTGSIEVPIQVMLNAQDKSEKGGERWYLTDKPGNGHGWQNWHVRRNIGRRVRNG